MPGLEITPDLVLPEDELTFETSRSGGPGGQHVNKVETRVTLLFDVLGSPSLSDAQRARILEKLRTRIGKDGRLRVSSGVHRSQGRNRAAVVERLVALLRGALAEEAPRVPTKVPKAAKRKRVDAKKRRGELKRTRRPPTGE